MRTGHSQKQTSTVMVAHRLRARLQARYEIVNTVELPYAPVGDVSTGLVFGRLSFRRPEVRLALVRQDFRCEDYAVFSDVHFHIVAFLHS